MNIIFSSVYDIGIVGRLIVLTLAILSVIAWGIIIEKIIIFARIRRESARFMALFQTFNDWEKIDWESRNFKPSPYLSLFNHIYAEVKSDFPANGALNKDNAENEPNETRQSTFALYRASADSIISAELMKYEKRLVVLSSAVSASPFLGLFGTVWGVMQAFMSIGLKGSAALTAIGPGIAEALITTVAGLAVAIPVLFAYNIIVDKIRKIENQMQILSNEMIKKILRGTIHGGS